MVTAVPIDFGNGIVAYSALHSGAEAYLEKGHRGFHAPELEVIVTENAVSDGGSVGATRALARHLRASISHNRRWTRREILQAFSPGVERTISTPLGSMPYTVEAPVEFPESLWESQFRFTVTLVSSLAYPLAGPESASTGSAASGGLVYPFAYPVAFDGVLASETLGVVSECEVVTPVKITAVLNVDADEITFTIGGRQTRVAGALTAGDVLVIDPTPSSPVVTVDGVNRIAWFDASTEWPSLDPGYSEISSSVLAVMTIEWEPRVLGLL